MVAEDSDENEAETGSSDDEAAETYETPSFEALGTIAAIGEVMNQAQGEGRPEGSPPFGGDRGNR